MTNAVQLTVPIGDDGQLMSSTSGGPPVLWLRKNAIQCVFRQVFSVKCSPTIVFRQMFSVKCFPSGVFRQVFSVKCFLSNARHLLDGGVFRSIGKFQILWFLMFFALRPGSNVHIIYVFVPSQKPWPKIWSVLELLKGSRSTEGIHDL